MYRIIKRGYKRFEVGCCKGMLIPIGWSVERLEKSGHWVLVGTVHPDDAEPFMSNLIKKDENR